VKEVLMALEDVKKTYKVGEVSVPALRGVTLEVYEGELLAIVGPSGAGKSTLLHLMGAMDRPTAGKIYYRGRDITRFSEEEMTAFRREKIGFIFQFFNLLPSLTAAENVELGGGPLKRALPVREVLEKVGLLHRADHFPSQLSGGEQQRVAIARAIVKDPDLLLCDEPTGALDLETGRGVLEILYQLAHSEGTTVVFITHNNAISMMANRIVRLRDGLVAEVTENETPLAPCEISW